MNGKAPPPRFVPTVAIASLSAILLAVAAGPFFTGFLPIPARTLFWASLIGVNTLKWILWYTLLPPRLPERWLWLLPVGGALLLNATLPFEVAFAYRAIGVEQAPDPLAIYASAVLISGLIAALVWVAAPRGEVPPQREPPSPEPPRGLAARVPLARLLAVTAEDHYIRLHLAGGGKPLILYRFSDAIADLAGIDGLQVHRGAWVAGGAVARATRNGRRWTLILTDGTEIPVSESRTAAARAKGLLRADARSFPEAPA
ncbi:LytTR family DNA-binding domain-containing protein [Thermaurantiacus sp.]